MESAVALLRDCPRSVPSAIKHSFPAQSSRDEVLNFVTRAKRAGLAARALARTLGVGVLLPRAFAAMLPAP